MRDWCTGNRMPVIGYHYVTTDAPAAQADTWHSNDGGSVAMLDWEDNGGDLANLTAVVDAFNATRVTVQLGYFPRWYFQEQGGGRLAGLTDFLVSSGYPAGGGFASTIYAAAGGDSGEGWAPYGGATPGAWQFTDRANVAGHLVDCNAYRGADIGVLFGSARAPHPGRAGDDAATRV